MKTKKRKKIGFTLLLFLLMTIIIWNSCTKEVVLDAEENEINKIVARDLNSNNSSYIQSYNFNNLALVVSEALKDNVNFRNMIKNEALIKFDGDYDILLKNFKDSMIVTGNQNLIINQFLDLYYQELGLSVIPFDESFGYNDNINHITTKYPKIQISVPVNVNTWNDSYNPIVTFIPADLDEDTEDYLIGYQDSSIVLVEVNTTPSDPVIVIGNNERVGATPPAIEPPIVSLKLSGSPIQSGIRISWEIESGMTENITGYSIFRKGNGTTEFNRIGNSNGFENTTFEDFNIEANVSYSYYVKAFNSFGSSDKSNTVFVTAPSVPSTALTFNANQTLHNEIELRWTHKEGQFIDHSELHKRVIGIDDDYYLYQTFNPGTHHYIESNVIHGKRVNYMFEEWNDLGPSNPKYDFVIVPYRDITQPTPVYIKRIKFNYSDINKIEKWFRGAPEFHITVVTTGNDGKPAEVQKNLVFEFDDRHSYEYFSNRNIYNWVPSTWMDILTFEVWEWDEGPDVDFTIKASYEKKDTTKGYLINGTANIVFEDLFDNDDEHVGKTILRYTDPETTIIEIPYIGFNITISTNDN